MQQFGLLSLGSRLKRLSDLLYGEVQEIYSELHSPIIASHFPVLRLLQQQGRQSVMEVADSLGLSHPAISRQMANLIKQGLVEKIQDEQDARRQQLQLSILGAEAMQAIAPALEAIKSSLALMTVNEHGDLLAVLTEFENRLMQTGLSHMVLEKMQLNQEIAVSAWQPCYKEAFKRLNMAWLEQFFADDIVEHDRLILNHPEAEVLARGGYIWFAIINQQAVGCCALTPEKNGVYKLSKLAVAEDRVGQGIGKKLMLTAIETARSENAKRLTLETSSKLVRALALYQRLGFVIQVPAQGYSVPRADIYMELAFPQLANT